MTDDDNRDSRTQPLAARLVTLKATAPTEVTAQRAVQRLTVALREEAAAMPGALEPTLVPASLAPVQFEPGDEALKLPAAWYAKSRTVAARPEQLSAERHSMMVRAGAAACFSLAFALFVWLSRHPDAPQTARAVDGLPPLASSLVPASVSADGAARTQQIPIAQILAVAERFVATGEVLAARAMLQDRAGEGDPRALFALAETYDPHLLASWGSQFAEPSVTYARFLYEAARRGGIAEAQSRLDALK